MNETRTRTTWELKVEARAVGDLATKLKRLFNRNLPAEFNREIAALNKALAETAETADAVAISMEKAAKAAGAFRSLGRDLRAANQEGARLRQTLDRVEAVSRGGGGRGGGPGAAGGGGWGGMHGLPSMQLGMPGIGAITAALGSIPVAGALAAGSLIAATSTYSSRLRFEQAQMDAAPFLTGSARALGYTGLQQTQMAIPGPSGPGSLVRDAVTGRAMPMGRAGLTGPELELLAELDTRGHFEKTLGRRVGGAIASITESAPVRFVRDITGANARRRARIESTALNHPEHLADDRIRAIANVGAERLAGHSGGQTVTITTNQPFDARSYTNVGLGMGVAPAQALQMATQLAQAAGRPVDAGGFEGALALQRLTGIGIGQTGGMMQALRRTGGAGDVQEVANLIGAAVARGLEGSELAEYLQAQTGFLGQMAQRGMSVDMERIRAMESALTSADGGGPGLAAFRAQSIVSQFGMGGAEVGFRGPQSAPEFRLMRAMGFTGKGGLEEFADIRLRMQDPGAVAEALPAYLEQFNLPRAGRRTQAFVLQQALAQIGGTRIGAKEAEQLIGASFNAETGQIDMGKLVESARSMVGATGANIRAEAGIEAERVKIGGQVAEAMQALARTTNNMAGSFMNTLGPALTQVSAKMEEFTAVLEKATSEMALFGWRNSSTRP